MFIKKGHDGNEEDLFEFRTDEGMLADSHILSHSGLPAFTIYLLVLTFCFQQSKSLKGWIRLFCQ